MKPADEIKNVLSIVGGMVLAILLFTGIAWWMTRLKEIINYGPAYPPKVQQAAQE